jgi:cob(I)alamin adenosyltransferase
LDILKNLPENKNIILTGRNAPKSFIKIADMVTEMREIKHPFSKGRLAKNGVEY